MKSILSIILSITFLLQSFVTIQAMPIHEGKIEMSCMVKQEVSKTHTCCTLLDEKDSKSEKKDCCSGTSKMSCCISVVALVPDLIKINFRPNIHQKTFFGYLEGYSSFEYKIFHPPILV